MKDHTRTLTFENGTSNSLREPGIQCSVWPEGADPYELFQAKQHRDDDGCMAIPKQVRPDFVVEEWLKIVYRLEYGFDPITGKDLLVECDEAGQIISLPGGKIVVTEDVVCDQCGYSKKLHPKDVRRQKYVVLCNGKRAAR